MRNTLLLCLAGYLLTTDLSAQQPFPTAADEPHWSVDWYFLGSFGGNETFSSSTSIELCGHIYSSVDEFDPEYPAYFRNDGQRTLLRRSTDCGEREFLMYDFSMEVGDTAYVGTEMVSPLDTTIAVIQNVDFVDYLGIMRKRLTVELELCPSTYPEPWYTTMYWIEGIGSSTHPFYPLICYCDFCETGSVLQCADSSGNATYRYSQDLICDFTSGLDEHVPAAGELQVLATGDNLQLIYPTGFQRGLLTILDPAGRVVFNEEVSASRSSLHLPELASDSYTVSIDNGDQRWAARWVLMR